MLVVVDVDRIATRSRRPMDAHPVTVPADQRPDPAEAWLWTHVQLLGTDTVPDDPSRSLARLVSPRRLQPDKRYLGCVVPTSEAAPGGSAWPGPDDPRGRATSRLQPVGDVNLPVYHWSGSAPARTVTSRRWYAG